MEGYTGITDNFGTYNFNDFIVTWGPEGLYAFQVYTTTGAYVYSEIFYIFLITQVSSLQVLNDYKGNFTVGTPFSTQPSVWILDFNGKEVPGKYAVMFSWIEPRYGDSTGVPGMIDGRKHFVLSGDVSEISNINGTATFSNLTVIGATFELAYLLFSVDGVVTAWTTQYNP